MNSGIGLSIFGPGSRVGLVPASLLAIGIVWMLLCIFGWRIVASNALVATLVKKFGHKTARIICLFLGLAFAALSFSLIS